MRGHSIGFAAGRDMALVVATAAIAFILGALSASVNDGHSSAPPNFHPPFVDASFAPVAAGQGHSSIDVLRLEARPDRHERGGPIVSAARPETPSQGAATPREWIPGEGAGQTGRTSSRNPYSRRAYIQETASLLYRRGWIGLEINPTAAARENPVYPARPDSPYRAD